MMEPKKTIKEIVHEEYKKCAIDPVHFSCKYCMVQHPMKGKIRFNLFPFQIDSLRSLVQHRFNIILKSRQMGISTLTAMYALHQMLFKSDFKVLVIATRQDVARNLVQKIKVMHSNLPNFLQEKVIDDNKLALSFANGSEVKAVSSSAHSGRSEALSLLIIDEMAFIEKADDIWASSQMTLSTGGSAILLSTPNGQGNLFARLWFQAESGIVPEGLDKFNTIRLPWDLHPERDSTWRKQQIELLGERMAKQECDCSFLSSGHTVIDSEIIAWLENNTVKEPVEKRGLGGDLWIFEYPNYNKNYVITADVARGDDEDYSAFQVFDIENLRQVAEFKSKIDTQSYGHLLVNIGNEYNNALLIIDNKNVGWSTIQVVIDKGYKNLYYSYKNDPYFDDNIQLRKAYDMRDKSDMVPGFTTTPKVRPVMISKLESYLLDEGSRPIIRSKRTIQELYTFVWLNGKPQASYGYNDDLVISLCMMLYIRDTAIRLHQQGIQLNKMALSKTHRAVYTPSSRNNHPNWSMPSGKDKESLTWLL